MNRLKENRGMTLIEIIVSVAILGILVIAFLNLFTFGYVQVVNAGHKSGAGFKAHQAAEQKIAGGTPAPSIVETSSPTTITIELPSPPSPGMTVSGQSISFEAEINAKKSKVTTFVP
ncbi:MAG: hypothetical protein K0R93_1391 [Anaerosolibacter sp.]|uniref:type IV pilus modification PilV family protein n=1 Tax=Anaerosolibacter sp. TaxID=1872527 RepID=UPI002608D800|nr:prepilin-type N-terminal cleavage/methylation domain-containing protein [Anaerosolibacter sp.]MDF2546493.1 hypothetical protein [Anaerosolibacter sp.]